MLEKDSKFNYHWLNEIAQKIVNTQKGCPCPICEFCENVHYKIKLTLESFQVSDVYKLSVTRYLPYQPYNHYNEFAQDFERLEAKVVATVDLSLQSDRKIIASLGEISEYMKKFKDDLDASKNLPELMTHLSLQNE